MTYEEAQKLKEGDKVLVTGTMKSYTDGWNYGWVVGMDAYVGKVCEVDFLNGWMGVMLIPVELGIGSYSFPWQVLERADSNWI